MERFKLVQLNPDNARLELFDGDKSLGYFWTPKMARKRIEELLKETPQPVSSSTAVNTVVKPVATPRGRPRHR